MKLSNSKQLKNRILLLTFIYRSLPTYYLKIIAKNDKEKEQIRLIVKNLINTKYLLEKSSTPLQFTFIHLSKKGYEYVVKEIFNGTNKPFYQHKESRSILKPLHDHSFLNFAFLWHYHRRYPSHFESDIHIYELSHINNCKVLFSYRGKDVLISPDAIIYLPDSKKSDYRKAVFVENDTWRETYKSIYQKVVEYLTLAEAGLKRNKFAT